MDDDGISSSPVFDATTSGSAEFERLRAENSRLEREFARGSVAVRRILDSIPVCVAYVDAEARYQFINGTYFDWFDLTEADLLGRSVHDLRGIAGCRIEERSGRMGEAVEGALRGEHQKIELHIDARNGRALDVAVQCVPNIDEQGEVQGCFILTEDITARREAAHKIEWSEMLLREALHSASMMAWEWDHRSRATRRTSNAEEVLGFVPEVTHTPIAQYIHPEDLARTRDVLLDSIRDMVPYVAQFRFQRPDTGEWRWLETRATPRNTESGVVVRGLICDVTERHQGDLQRRANEERLRLAQRVGGLGTWHWDLATNAVSWSPEMEALHGLAEGEFGGTFQEFVERVHPKDREAVLASVEDLQTHGSHEVEHRIIMPDGSIRWLYGRGELFRDMHGIPTHAIGVAQDVTERRREADARERLVEDLRAANAAKDELLGLVSHELRTPLTTLGGTASALRRHGDRIEPRSREAALLDIERDAVRLEQIIENMLTLARAEAEQSELLEPLLLRRVIAAELREQRERFPELQTTLHTPEELLPVLGQEGYVRQIFSNLLSNASKYGGQSPIDIFLERVGDEAVVTVADRGKGITSEDASRVFEAFFRSEKTAGRVSGIGLGLTVCKRLTELQGGRIWYEPREGGGAAFKFALPIVEVSAEP